MSWEDIIKRVGMSKLAEELIKEVMNTSSEKLTVTEISEKIIQLAERSHTKRNRSHYLRRVPTSGELGNYLSKNYSFDIENRRHPITGNMRKTKVYFKEE